MKIIYGVQGTGNGHLTRARVMAKEFTKAGIEVDYLFSGRPSNQFFDMADFYTNSTVSYRKGLSFHVENGRISSLKTVLNANFSNLKAEIDDLDLSSYDAIISDFEPVVAHAARRQKRKVIGIGHQYAFDKQIPKAGFNPISSFIMSHYAPATTNVGLHWHHFDQNILPPIIDTSLTPLIRDEQKIVVYMPFENLDKLAKILAGFTHMDFVVVTKEQPSINYFNVMCLEPSVTEFKKHLASCAGVITNAGFELVAECLHLGKKVLVRPLSGQAEQVSNAKALAELGYGHVMETVKPYTIARFLGYERDIQLKFPNVAQALVQSIKNTGTVYLSSEYVKMVWNNVK